MTDDQSPMTTNQLPITYYLLPIMKTLIPNRKSLKYLVWFGPFLIAMGLSAGLVGDSWIPIPIALIIAGIVVLGLWLIFQDKGDLADSRKFWERRSTQAGTNALIATIAFISILALINLVSARNLYRVDLTENQLFTLSLQSQQVVRNLNQPVKVWIFASQPNPQDLDLLEKYRRQGRNFSFEYANPDTRLDLMQKFKVTASGEVHLESGERQRFIQTISNEETGERLSEARLTNGLQQIKSDRTDKIYFLQGHGELPLQAGQEAISLAVQSLNDKNFKSEPLNLAERLQVPDDANVVAIARPRQALFEPEVNALRDYLKRGGSLLLMLDPNTNPNLDNLLQEWGIKLDKGLVINASQKQVRGFGPAAAVVNQYGDHPITKDFGDRFSFYYLARAIEITPVSDVNATPLLLTSNQTWSESDTNSQESKFDPTRDRQGPLTLGVALSRRVDTLTPPNPSASPTPTNAESRLVVIGNSSFATDSLFGQYINGDVFLNSISWLSKRDEQTLSIRPKQANNRRINLSLTQVRILILAALAIAPLIGFITGGILWWKRR
jgi:ABC-type uncharacterized transport system involved in gliding motility auxiliary subunit